ncbi:phasin family protein [Eubacterium oxidoreducens]|uniref:Polyhydroxyalkanoate synthesis regulator phasin n=1 Tax=Eubacterium oxidoreducens TaxID=1732 RepID=A0A1G6CAM9_EUBOX|nr:aspartyl beta-hydroxylase [Eubacterium oxidoreducens]SDB29822.1 Polyhydroxyalkanoate synthesis regulator phasin [Eubacterium oxidoreducens]
MDKFSEGIRKFFLAGVGAVATTAEKSQEIINDLVEKGELTVEQGKAMNEELKHKVTSRVNPTPEERADHIVGKLSEEELEALKAKLAEMEEDGEEEE